MKFYIPSIIVPACIIIVYTKTLQETATDLHYKIGHILIDVYNLEFAVIQMIRNVSSMDFGINENKKMKELRTEMDKKKNARGITECRRKYNTSRDQVVSELQASVNDKLKGVRGEMIRTEKELTRVQKRLIGNALKDEKAACAKSANLCNITGRYHKYVDDTDSNTKFQQRQIGGLLSQTIEDRVTIVIQTKIDVEIFKNVMSCVTKLRNNK